jgi:hypothetical protein
VFQHQRHDIMPLGPKGRSDGNSRKR